MEIATHERWFYPDGKTKGDMVLKKVVMKEDWDILLQAYREMQTKYDERGMAMRDTGEMVRSLFMPYLGRIKAALLLPDDLDALTEIAKAIKEFQAHTTIA